MAKAIDPRVVEVQSRIFAGRLDLNQVLSRAGVHRTTWWRWVNGTDPRRDTLLKIDNAIRALLQEKEDQNGSASRLDEQGDGA